MQKKPLLIVFAVFLLVVGFALGQFYLRVIYQRQTEMGYQRALAEFATHLQALSGLMSQARIAFSATQRGLIGADIRRLAYAAQSNLGGLPLGELQLERIACLLAKVYEETYSYGRFGPCELEELCGQIEYVNEELQGLLRSKQGEDLLIPWQEYLAVRASPFGPLQALGAINEGLEELKIPRRSGEIKGEEIGAEQALEIARNFSEEELNFQVTGENKGVNPSYTVEGKDGGHHLILEISKKGGLVLWMASQQEVESAYLTREEMVQRATEFLERKGFPPLQITDAQLLQNRVTFTFVPKREGILRYAEPLRIQISAADGNVLGFWAAPFYIAQSRQEQLPEMASSLNWSAQEKVRPGAEILSQKPALIVGAEQNEVLVQRLGVHYQDEYYLIYLNALDGGEELIVPVSSPEFF